MSTGWRGPTGLAFSGSYAYVANSGNDTVFRCNVTPEGGFAACEFSVGGFTVPNSITINDADTFSYMTNGGDSSVSRCSVDVTGMSSCQKFFGFNAPRDVVRHGSFAFIANRDSDNIIRCSVNEITGDLSACAAAASGFNDPMGLGINRNNDLYVTNFGGNSVSKCSIAADGSLSGCAVVGAGFTGPRDIDFTADGQDAYITNFSGSNIFRCAVLSDGVLTGCAASGGFNATPTVIVIRALG